MGYYERMREHSLVKKYIYLFILKNPLEFDLFKHAKNSTKTRGFGNLDENYCRKQGEKFQANRLKKANAWLKMQFQDIKVTFGSVIH